VHSFLLSEVGPRFSAQFMSATKTEIEKNRTKDQCPYKVRNWIICTLKSMAGYDHVNLPYEFMGKRKALINSIPEDEFDGCFDNVEPDI
jgi:hypothetical protein